MQTARTADPVSITGSQLTSIKASFTTHYNKAPLYQRFCNNCGFTPDSLSGIEDIKDIPLIPTQMFKHYDILSVPEENIVKVCTSSGTRGSVSRVLRDGETLQTFTMGTARRIGEVITQDARNYTMLCLGPREEESKDLWIAYIMSLLGGVTATQKYYVKDNKFLLADLIEDLKQAGQSQEKLAIIGPPMYFLYLAEELTNNNLELKLNPDSYVVTMGGWKRDEKRAVSRTELEKTALDVLGLPASQLRDGYGAVELNSVLFDCINKHKHLPEWVIAIARDPDTLAPLPYGEEGILSFLDTSASSYPCFILTEDFGTVYPAHSCGCEVSGDYVQISRRVNRVESKGCALKMNSAERTHYHE